MAAIPLDGIFCPTRWTNTPALVATACFEIARILRSFSSKVFLRRPTSATPPPWDRTHGLLLPTWEGITRKSLPRTGRATLMASSSTGEQHRKLKKRLPAGWSVPRTLGQLALALAGMLHPTSTTPSHVFRAGFVVSRTVRIEGVQVASCSLKQAGLKISFRPRSQGQTKRLVLGATLASRVATCSSAEG